MRKKRYFQNLYKFEKEGNKYLIEVALDDYDDVYDDWDPTPFKKRDIEDEFNDYIFNSSEDIPLNYEIGIVLYLPDEKKDEKKEAALISAYQNFYNYAVLRLCKVTSALHRRIVSNLVLSGSFLSFGYFWGGTAGSILLGVMHEGIIIGGWVFLWEFFTNFFMRRRELHEEYKLYDRLFKAEIRFVYH
ncbi:hypothetical protein [Dethiobacter alkaliphilus]|uniref:hypothetical protein n=1 Tax=Dethiobacter alkaliphilus TaxID=427926 RepID=UPI00117CC29C|nr:hypothetical protein [Dethiobacter alkaliphilus]